MLGQRDQVGVGPTGVEPGECVGQVAQRGLALKLARSSAEERGLPGEDFAEDRPQGEDVGPLIDPVDLAPRLLGGHVGRSAQDRSGSREVGISRAAAGGGDDRFILGDLAGRLVVDDPAARQHFRQAPVHHLHFAERSHHYV